MQYSRSQVMSGMSCPTAQSVCRRSPGLSAIQCVARPRHSLATAQPQRRSSGLKLLSVGSPLFSLAGLELLRGPFEPIARLLGAPAGTPEAIIHWGHPFFMSFVLLVMGGAVAQQGWAIRTSSDAAVIEKAKDSHPKIAGAMAAFFAIGAFGGMGSMLTQQQSLLSSSHSVTALIGLSLLAFQAMLTLFFADDPNARGFHAYLGSATLAFFVIHAAIGIKLGLSIA